jgi:hypothetical protein
MTGFHSIQGQMQNGRAQAVAGSKRMDSPRQAPLLVNGSNGFN